MIVTFTLLAIGLIMVYSASAIWAEYKFQDSFFFAKRQTLFAGVGIAAMFFIMNINYWTWRTCVVMIFIAGARISHFALLGLLGVAWFIGLIASAPYRIKRITSFLDPWSDPLGSGFQIIQSLYAIGPGGLFGLGLGESR